MPRFSANLSFLYGEHAFLDRFEAAARDGFRAVEFAFGYEYAPVELAARLGDLGLRQVLFNAPPGGTDAASIDRAWAAADRGTACGLERDGKGPALRRVGIGHTQRLGPDEAK